MSDDDHRALIEQVRKEHVPCADRDRCPEPLCTMCAEDYPCLTARLATALEQALADETLNEQVVALGLDLEAAMKERDVALARVAQAERERDELRAAIDKAWATTQAALASCASRSQDPAGAEGRG